jgi:glycosyltransferase involved in cell wall biosynthesis
VFPDGPEGPVVGMFGRIDHWKGQDVFTRAAAEVARRHAGAQFVVVGGDFYQTARTSSEDIRRLADDLGIGTRFHVLGDRPDAVSLMGGCTVVAHCSRSFEPFGVVVVEAMLMGAAVVATRTGGPEEILDAASGVLVPPDDVAALAEAVDRLLGDPLSRAGLVSEARARARALFSADASADALLDAYDHFRGGRARCLPDNMEQ